MNVFSDWLFFWESRMVLSSMSVILETRFTLNPLYLKYLLTKS